MSQIPSRNPFEDAPLVLPGGGGSALGALASIAGDAALLTALNGAIVGAKGIGQITVPISSAQFGPLFSTPVLALPAPPAGNMIFVYGYGVQWRINTVYGSGGGSWQLRWGNGQLLASGSSRSATVLGDRSIQFVTNSLQFTAGTIPTAQSLSVHATADAAGGAATASVTIIYRITPITP